jgi:hypothetical protein
MTSFDRIDSFQMAGKILRFGSDQPKEDFAVINIVRQQERQVQIQLVRKRSEGGVPKIAPIPQTQPNGLIFIRCQGYLSIFDE